MRVSRYSTNFIETEQKTGRLLIQNEEIVCIQTIWRQEFDVAFAAYEIAEHHGREVSHMIQPKQLPPGDKEILQIYIKKYELQEEWIESLLYLVNEKYPNLQIHGSRQQLKEDVKRIIENEVYPQGIADPNQ